jgi:hypothetical protein
MLFDLPRATPILLALLALSIAAPPARATDPSPGCSGVRPAATLLFPYFEVDLDGAGGKTTLVTVGNASEEPVLAHLVFWTNCGLPVLDFTLYLEGDAVQPINLWSVFAGHLPVTGPPAGSDPLPGCTAPLTLPEVDVPALRARLSGRPDPADGLCYGVAEEGRRAVGYLTVDAVRRCPDTAHTPLDDGYFSEVASSDNVLWGELLYVDPGQDLAQGIAAVPVAASEPSPAGPEPKLTARGFYSGLDDRYPLGSSYRARFLDGGGFDGGTRLIVWSEVGLFGIREPFPCGADCSGSRSLSITLRSQAGEFLDQPIIFLDRLAFTVEIGGEEVPTPADFGVLETNSFESCPICSPPGNFPSQSWVIPTYTASGRFSVALDAVRLDCP